jgi:tellurite resistance protein
VLLFDRVIEAQPRAVRDQQRLEGMAVACLFLACKAEEVKPPSLQRMLMCIRTNSAQQLIELERQVMQLVSFRIINTTAFEVLNHIIYQWRNIQI